MRNSIKDEVSDRQIALCIGLGVLSAIIAISMLIYEQNIKRSQSIRRTAPVGTVQPATGKPNR